MNQIMLSGKIASGKTELSKRLQERLGYQILTISVTIRKVSSYLVSDHGKLERYLLERFGNKEKVDTIFQELKIIQELYFQDGTFEFDEEGLLLKKGTYRLLTQKVARKVRDLCGEGIWVKLLLEDTKEMIENGERLICDDAREKEEKEYFEMYHFKTIRLDIAREEQKRRAKKRGDGELTDEMLDHSNECALDHETFDLRFDTTSLTEEEVYAKVLGFLDGDKKNYEYGLCVGEYEDYREATLYHAKKFTNKEFVEMYNSVVEEIEFTLRPSLSEIVNGMAEKYGFEVRKANCVCTIWAENMNYDEPISLDKIDEKEKLIRY